MKLFFLALHRYEVSSFKSLSRKKQQNNKRDETDASLNAAHVSFVNGREQINEAANVNE